ncbi:hypothetical protein FH972_025805 [Carpinus fangiana]|uniref:Short-chain dehydrogenase/reductase 3 n=1 Tax=Carpinus fangiana TaxID=176857 RepID=A0A5N6L328_9ROSI|nr:hypothetical protein FH972_025805 [Carpinus fangiana]
MAALLRFTLFEPVVTGAVLLGFFYGPPEVREKVAARLSTLPFHLTTDTLVRVFQGLFALGVARRVSGFIDWLSFRNWELFYSGAPWAWDQEVAVVTGGSGDIATELIKKLIAKGIKVAVLDVQQLPAATKNEKLVKFYKCDLTSSAAVHEAALAVKKDLGTPTILVNNAGIAIGAPITQISDAKLDLVFKVNLISQWYTVREFLPGMIDSRKGHIVTVASMASYTGVAGISDYCATKAGALAFHECLTQEIRHLHQAPFVRTTCAHPFWTSTAMVTDIKDGIKKTDALITPQYVGDVLARAIFSKNGAHVVIPDYNPKMRVAPLLRGLPSWINSIGNDTTKENILTAVRANPDLIRKRNTP